jgi:putative ABC transport system permease protein
MIVQRILVPALRTLRIYWGTAVLLAAACAAGLGAMLPVTGLLGPAGARLASGLSLHPVRGADWGLVWGAFARSPTEVRQAAVAALFPLLVGVAVGVLAVTWFTTLSVSTARASGRATEIAVRRAVGASRRTLLGAALLEGGCVAVLALVVGGASGLAAARLAIGSWPGTVGAGAPALSLLAVVATLGGIILGTLLPLVFARPSARMTAVDPTPLALVVPAAQLGLSLTVLVTASLLERGAGRLTPSTSAWSAAGEVFEITTRDFEPAGRAAAYASLLGDLQRNPAIDVASLSSPGALTGIGEVDNVTSNCGACSWGGLFLPFHPFFATLYVASADTFRALRLPVIAGRIFTEADGWDQPRVAVVSRSLAAQHFEGGDAVGRTMLIGHGSLDWYTVVGVVEDQRPVGIGGGGLPAAAAYLSVLQHPATAVDLLVRGRAGPAPRAPVARSLRERLGSRVSTVEVSEASLLAAEAAPVRWFGRMFGAEGWALLTIATVGTFAVMWLWVTSLLGEFGVRRAVGARRRDVLRYVVARALLVAAGGVAFGCWLGMIVWDALTSAVSGIPPWDSGALLRFGLLLAAAALSGALVPAWRAARTPPAALLAS